MDLPLNCLVGLKVCEGVDALNLTDNVVRWWEIVGAGSLVIAAGKYLQEKKFRYYVLFKSNWSMACVILLLLSVFSVVFAHILPLILLPVVRIFGVSSFAYPATWELISMGLLTILFILILLFAFFEQWFVPRITKRNIERIYGIVEHAIIQDRSPEAIAAAARIIEGKSGNNLERLISIIRDRKKIDPKVIELATVHIVDHLLSSRIYLDYLSREDFIQTYDWYRFAHEKGMAGVLPSPHTFFHNLTKELYQLEDSHFGKDLQDSEHPINQSLISVIFESLESLALFGAFPRFTEIKPYILKRYGDGLKVSLHKYYSSTEYQRPNSHIVLYLSFAFRDFPFRYRFYELPKEREQMMNHPSYQLLEITKLFFYDLGNLIHGYHYEQQLSEDEKLCKKGTLAEELVAFVFDYLDELSTMKNSEFAVETIRTNLYWIVFERSENEFLKNIMSKLAELIKERIEFNILGGFHSMIKQLFGVYGWLIATKKHKGSPIGEYLAGVFYEKIADKLFDPKFAEQHLPFDWRVNVDAKTIELLDGEKKYVQIYPAK